MNRTEARNGPAPAVTERQKGSVVNLYGGADLQLYRMLKPVGKGGPKVRPAGADAVEVGVDYEAQSLKSYALEDLLREDRPACHVGRAKSCSKSR